MFENERTWNRFVENNSTDDFQKEFGKNYPLVIGGKEIFSNDNFQVRSPADKNLILGNFPTATKENTLHAIEAAKDSFYKWSLIPYQKRVQIFREVADVFSHDK